MICSILCSQKPIDFDLLTLKMFGRCFCISDYGAQVASHDMYLPAGKFPKVFQITSFLLHMLLHPFQSEFKAFILKPKKVLKIRILYVSSPDRFPACRQAGNLYQSLGNLYSYSFLKTTTPSKASTKTFLV